MYIYIHIFMYIKMYNMYVISGTDIVLCAEIWNGGKGRAPLKRR